MAFVGFDSSKLMDTIGIINNSYSRLYNSLYSSSRNYLEGISKVWADGNAIEFAKRFESNVNKILDASTEVFTSINNSMNSAGMAWNEANNSTSFSNVPFTSLGDKIDGSIIQPNINGREGMDVDEVVSLTKTMSDNVLEDASEALLRTLSFLNSEEVFIGGNQQSNLISSLQDIANDIINVVNENANIVLKETGRNIDINRTVEQKISNAFLAR